jgi:hypothetical protein
VTPRTTSSNWNGFDARPSPFADAWRRHSPQQLLVAAARLYWRARGRCAPIAAAVLALSVCVSALAASGAWQVVPSSPPSVVLARAASLSLLVMLLATPFTAVRAIRVVVGECVPETFRIAAVRFYRLTAIVAYHAVPLVVLFAAFPLGVVALWFYGWWMFAPHAVVVEGAGGRAALRRSRMLTLGEFSASALPVVVTFALYFVGLAAALRLVPSPPPGFAEDAGGYVRPLAEGETYDPVTRWLKHPDKRVTHIPEGAAYDEESRVLRLEPPPPPALGTALAWVGVPVLLAGMLDPIRWLVVALLYVRLRVRREGLTAEAFLAEIAAESS